MATVLRRAATTGLPVVVPVNAVTMALVAGLRARRLGPGAAFAFDTAGPIGLFAARSGGGLQAMRRPSAPLAAIREPATESAAMPNRVADDRPRTLGG